MKGLKTSIFSLLLILSTATAPLWAIWEGNAGIAAAGEFPSSGLFARSDMFPKNTIVEIQNLETEITIRAVITGPSGVPGLVAVLSPETASALSVRAGSVSRVRISVPSAVSETAARGTLSSPTASVNPDPDSNPAAAAAMAKIDLETTNADTSADDLISALGSEAAAEDAPAVQETPAEQTPAEESIAAQETAIPEDSAATAPASIIDTAPDLPASESPASVSEAFAAKEPELPSEAPAAAAPEVLDDPVAEAPETAPEHYFAEPELSLAADEPAEAIAEPAAAVASDAPVPSIVPETEVSLVPSAERPPEAPVEQNISAVPVVPEIAAPAAPSAETAPSPIETVPSIAVVPSIRAPSKAASSASAAVVPPVQASAAPIAAAIAPAPAPAAISGLPFISSFAKGSYYVQIASCAETLNAKKIVDEWGASYPVVVERSSSAKGELLKVYVGPVQKDEYGAVLERFRQLGFKDAFVKKAN